MCLTATQIVKETAIDHFRVIIWHEPGGYTCELTVAHKYIESSPYTRFEWLAKLRAKRMMREARNNPDYKV